MGRPALRLPPLPPKMVEVLSRLPFQNQIDPYLERATERIYQSGLVQKAQSLVEVFPVIESITIPTPFGALHTQRIELPDIVPPRFKPEDREAIKAALGMTIGNAIELIPVVGDIVGQIISDHYAPLVRESLSASEYAEYQKKEKLFPPIVALLTTLSQERRKTKIQRVTNKARAAITGAKSLIRGGR